MILVDFWAAASGHADTPARQPHAERTARLESLAGRKTCFVLDRAPANGSIAVGRGNTGRPQADAAPGPSATPGSKQRSIVKPLQDRSRANISHQGITLARPTSGPSRTGRRHPLARHPSCIPSRVLRRRLPSPVARGRSLMGFSRFPAAARAWRAAPPRRAPSAHESTSPAAQTAAGGRTARPRRGSPPTAARGSRATSAITSAARTAPEAPRRGGWLPPPPCLRDPAHDV